MAAVRAFLEDFLKPLHKFLDWLQATKTLPTELKLARLGEAVKELRTKARDLKESLDATTEDLELKEVTWRTAVAQRRLAQLRQRFSAQFVEERDKAERGRREKEAANVLMTVADERDRAGAGVAKHSGAPRESGEGSKLPVVRFRLNNYMVQPRCFRVKKLDAGNPGLPSDVCVCRATEEIAEELKVKRLIVPHEAVTPEPLKAAPMHMKRTSVHTSFWIMAHSTA
uniref:Uncharacterized protein n=1 Tax=Phaeomonas parva TaxID=124430 RepID=A0A7S1XM91_9STRA|mmetsp:Transcript_2131/g.6448  ORF Transcript_2131/g.6448 Transcript_2131/m.6448 type:complete len:227 (+) Transcript_2131:161-841(+)|eukprot:CAMPEP_0118880232 /NCGR_PEP_ID=MMETSP1163-20130328/19826_1 /TAXON_ID=124430 /ORGANISM="Phaeomonas parva, Strain CCMP2877" /LENGTH=226 /DNA_ID=CAMNT_0006816573 /DNA_START=125 /DNA_END=805 /DNA_ORIENTATION=+